MRTIHIVAGMLSLLAGAVALYAVKGSTWHRRGGQVFTIAMLTMSSSAFVIAAFLRPNRVNAIAGALTFYLVCTGFLAVRRTVEQARGLLTGLMLLALMGGAYASSLGFEALASANGRVEGIPPQPLFMFGIFGLAGGLLDARLLLAGSIQGAHRIVRHLWRMGFAMWIATASFFLGQAKLFPEAVRESGLLAIPVLVVAGLVLYWLVRVLRRRRQPLVVRST